MSAEADRPTVRVIMTGIIVRNGASIEDASSTVSLIELGNHRIIVDTGAPNRQSELLKSLRALDVSPESVETVVNTHMHVDHIGGNDLFANARLFAHELEEPPLGTVKLSGERTLLPGVTVVPTPGHTCGSVSVFVEGRRRHAIVGDAIPTRANSESMAPPAVHFNRNLALRSMEAVLAWADIVVPGHDSVFEVPRGSNNT